MRASETATIEERLAAALKFRLAMLEPHVSTWPQAMAVSLASPPAARDAARAAWGMVDDMWYHATRANAAVDPPPESPVEFHLRRKLLLGAYVASELQMLTDYSPGFRDTWESVDRRVARAVRLERDAGNAAALAGILGGSLIRRMAGAMGGAEPKEGSMPSR